MKIAINIIFHITPHRFSLVYQLTFMAQKCLVVSIFPHFCDFLDKNFVYHGVFSSDIPEYIKKEVDHLFELIIYIKDYEKNVKDQADMLCQHNSYDYIIGPCESDILLAAELRDKFDVKGQNVESAICYRDKTIMKNKLKQAGIRVPKFAKINDVNTIFEFMKECGEEKTVVIKPYNSSGSRGVHVINSKEQLLDVIKEIFCDDRYKEYEIEEYIDGEIYHVDGIWQNNKIKVIYPSKYVCPCALTSFQQIDCSYIIEKSELSDKLCDFAEKVIYELQKTQPDNDIVFHLELFYNKLTGEIVFCEVGCRAGGNRIFDNWERSFGINLLKEQIKLSFSQKDSYCDENVSSTSLIPTVLTGSFYIPAKQGTISYISKQCSIEGIKDYMTFYNTGDTISCFQKQGFKNKLAFGFVVGLTEKELLDNLEQFKKWFYESTIIC